MAMEAPQEIRVSKDRRTLSVTFAGETHALSAEMLRVLSPSAEVKGHGAADRVTLGGKIDVAIAGLEPVGSYAVRIAFDDGHDTGLYTWDYLRGLGREKDRHWRSYLDALAAAGLSRDRPGQR